jgi:recombination protein RecT
MSNIKQFFEQDTVKTKFAEMLGKRAPQFLTSVLQIATSNEMLKNADAISIYNAAAVAATLDLPLNNSLGFAYIVPYNAKQKDGSYKQVAQFQLGYKGFIQLAQRSGQFQTISAKAVYEGQIIDDDGFEGYAFNWKGKKSEKVIGYAAYFRLLNGFEKTLYMTVENIKGHGLKFSKTYGSEKTRKYSLWETDFESMAQKTVLKLLLSKFAPLSVEMQKAVITDQSVINDVETTDVTYIDNDEIAINKEHERMRLMLNECANVEALDALYEHLPEELYEAYLLKKEQLSEPKGGKK